MTSPTVRKKFLWFLLWLNLALLPVLFIAGRSAFFYGRAATTPDALPVYARMPEFELTREDGTAFGSARMRGGLWLADFMFTRCQNQCPMMSVKFRALQGVLPPETRLVSFSVDPGHDTPEILKAYADEYKARADKWVFLTGDQKKLQGLMKALHLGSEDDPAMHSLRFVLLDKSLRVRGYYDSTETESLAKMKTDIEQLRKEK